MIVSKILRTVDLAQAAGISVQQVRNYEAGNFIPPVERSPSGYRLYTEKHLTALKTARSLLGGYGWQQAREIMQAVHQANLPTALALIDERHAELARKRAQVEQTLAALRTLATQTTPAIASRHSPRLRIGEAAGVVGVRVSALHFWEQQGLVQPVREPGSRYRLYDESQMRRLRVVVMLREAGYGFPAIHNTLNELAAGQPEKAIAAVEKRRADFTRTSWACLVGTSALRGYLSGFWPELLEGL
jgi:DNA-binding transcriptional MerR regulator